MEQFRFRLSRACRLNRFIGEIQRARSPVEAQELANRIGDEMLKAFRGVEEDVEAAERLEEERA